MKIFDQKDYQDLLWGITIAIAIAVATTLWVPLHTHLLQPEYYNANLLEKIQMRAFMGSIAQAMHLSPLGFIALIQAFKINWLMLLCWQFFLWLQNRYVATIFCVMFGFSYAIFSDNVVSGFVDMPANFWLLCATSIILSPQKTNLSNPKRWLFVASLFLIIAMLTHEKTIFITIPLLLWSVIRYSRKAYWIIAPYFFLMALFFLTTRNTVPTYGLTALGYIDILLHKPLAFFMDETANFIGIFYGVGVLWCVYFFLGYKTVRSQATRKLRIQYSFFLFASIIVNFITLFFAADIPRMMNGLWLSIFILLIDQRDLLEKMTHSSLQKIILGLCCILHILIPPLFIYARGGSTPINCYADHVFPFLQSTKNEKGWFWLWHSGRQDIHGELQCWPPTFIRH